MFENSQFCLKVRSNNGPKGLRLCTYIIRSCLGVGNQATGVAGILQQTCQKCLDYYFSKHRRHSDPCMAFPVAEAQDYYEKTLNLFPVQNPHYTFLCFAWKTHYVYISIQKRKENMSRIAVFKIYKTHHLDVLFHILFIQTWKSPAVLTLISCLWGQSNFLPPPFLEEEKNCTFRFWKSHPCQCLSKWYFVPSYQEKIITHI